MDEVPFVRLARNASQPANGSKDSPQEKANKSQNFSDKDDSQGERGVGAS